MVVIGTTVRKAVLEHAQQMAPKEACGVLGGQRCADRLQITRADPAENIADDPTAAYKIAPAVALKRIEQIENDGDDHLGFWHSHPASPAEPSVTDRAQAAWPGYTYLIVSLSDSPAVRAWKWTGETFAERQVSVE